MHCKQRIINKVQKNVNEVSVLKIRVFSLPHSATLSKSAAPGTIEALFVDFLFSSTQCRFGKLLGVVFSIGR